MAGKPKQKEQDSEETPGAGDKDLDFDQLEALLRLEQGQLSTETPRAGRRRSGAGRDRKARDDADYRMLADVLDEDRAVKVVVHISDDGLQATVDALHPGVTCEDVMEALREQDVRFGVAEEVIRKGVTWTGRTGQMQRNVVVARGVPPAVEREGRIDYRMPVARTKAGVTNTPGLGTLKALLEERRASELETVEMKVKAVRPGDPLLVRVQPCGSPGRDVFGREISLDSLEAALPEPGEHVQALEDGRTCVSKIYGYAGIIDGVVEVLSPIWISPDNMEVYFLNLPQVGRRQAPKPEDIRELLALHLVEYGIDEQGIVQVCKQVSEGDSTRFMLVAQGEEGQPGRDAEVRMAFDSGRISPLSHVKHLLNARRFEDLAQGQDLLVQAVSPGQTVAIHRPPMEGTFGRDVFGEEIPVEPGRDRDLVEGENVEALEDGRTCVSKIYGYAGLIDGVVEVLSPIWISPDNMEVYFLNLPQVGKVERPGPEDVRQLLKLAGVVCGIDETCIAALCEGRTEALCVRIAEGTRPMPGLDAELSFAFDAERKPGEILKDGSIDFKRLNLAPIVQVDQFLAEKKPATKGVMGKDVTGRQVAASNGGDLTVTAGKNVRVERDGGNLRCYSKIRGGVGVRKVERGRGGSPEIALSVNQAFAVARDVDYSTGNIDFPGDVHVGGSVRSGFSIKSGGSVAIGGSVEENASVSAEGDVLVARGIVGQETGVVAGGCVRAKFVENASVRAGGDVEVGSHLFNGSVRSGGAVTVYGRGSRASKALIGGFVWAKKGVLARSVGSAYANRTRLIAGVDAELFKRLTSAQKALTLCEGHILRVLRTLGLTALDAAQIKRVLRAARQGKQQDFVVTCVNKLNGLLEAKRKLTSAIEALKTEMKQVAEEAAVEVQERVFPGVDVRIGSEQIRVEEEAGRIRFQLVEVEEDGTHSIQQMPLR